MRKEKLLWLTIIVFAVMNISCLAFILLGRNGRPPHRVDKIIIEGLQLDDNQIEEFEGLKHEHHEAMMQIDLEMKQPMKQYFGLLSQAGNQHKKDSLETLIAALYKEKLNVTYAHFADLKAICRPDQQKKLDEIMPSLMQIIGQEKKDGPPRGRE